MQFLVIARDGTDDEGDRTAMGVRPSYLDAIQPLVDAGHVLVGGATLNEADDMIGSMSSSTSIGRRSTHGSKPTRTSRRRVEGDRGLAVPSGGGRLGTHDPHG